MAARRGKKEQTTQEVRGASLGVPMRAPEAALVEPPAQRVTAQSLGEKEEEDPREERRVHEPAAHRPPASSRVTPAPSRELYSQLCTVLNLLDQRLSDVSWASEEVNKLVKRLRRALKASEFHGVKLLNFGSYYKPVKISEPTEFDVMFALNISRFELVEYAASGAYYSVKFKRNPKGNPLDKFVEGESLSAAKVLLRFREIIKAEIDSSTPAEDKMITVQKKIPGSPAVTLLIKGPEEISVNITLALELKSRWPPKTMKGLPIERWLGRKVTTSLRQKPFNLIPKLAKKGRCFQGETWHLSFPHIENTLLNDHGHTKTCCEADGVRCCRKDCLELMKYLLEQLKKKFEKQKEMSKFCSYHVKTAFFHVCAEHPDDSLWKPKNINVCFDSCVAFFIERLREEELNHFFIPEVNLFSQEYIDQKNKTFLAKQIEYERNNRFPIFNEF